MKRALLAASLILLALGVCAAAPERGDKAPVFSAKDLGGKAVSLSALKGKQNVLLAFWSPNCLISASEVNALQKNLTGFAGKPLTVLGVVSDRMTAAQVAAWSKQHKVTTRSLLDVDRKMLKSYGIGLTPTFVLIDKQGVVQARYVGSNREIRTALAGDIDKLLSSGAVPESESKPQTGSG